MIVSEHWLREWIDPDLDTAGLVDKLTMAGLEVDSIGRAGEALPDIVIGLILQAAPHPDADKLQVCEVNAGGKQPLQVVCGAANARPGLRVPLALAGARLPGGHRIEPTRLRGVASQGMLCSGSDLGLEELSEGLLELDADAVPGQPVDQYLQLDDAIIEIDLTPNRGDCLSILGIARELNVLTGAPLKRRDVPGWPAEHDQVIPLAVQAQELCPRYVGRVVNGVDGGARSPVWMRERLRRSGVRPINAVVDITNYVMLELGQPMHAFDKRRLRGGIVVRTARARERISLLDDSEIDLSPGSLVIADRDKPIALAGIMGGRDSAVDDSTCAVVLEAAHFSPAAVVGKARLYGKHTESSHRFERGVDAELPRVACQYASALLRRLAGAEPGPLMEVAARRHLPARAAVKVRGSRVIQLLGTDIPGREVSTILQRVAKRVQRRNDVWTVRPPSFRFDLHEECDLIEEVARVRGYDRIPAARPVMEVGAGTRPESWLPLRRIREALVDRDYREAINYSFVDPALQGSLTTEPWVSLANPLASNMSAMRNSLWPGLLTAAINNLKRQQSRVRLFEIGKTFHPRGARDHDEMERLGGVATGDAGPPHWDRDLRAMDFFDVKGDLEAVLAMTRESNNIAFRNVEHPALHPGQGSEIVKAGRRVGLLGRLHPQLQTKLDLDQAVFLFEFELHCLQQGRVPSYRKVSRFPAIRRDLAILVSEDTTARDVLECVRTTVGEHLSKLELFDVYRGEGVDSGRKSLAFSLTLQSSSRTLTDVEVDSIMTQTLDALRARHGAELRS